MIWGAMQINRGGCYPPRLLACMILHIIRKTHSIFYYSFKICKFLTTLPPRRLSANHLPLSYPGCQRLFMRGFRFREKNLWCPGYLFLGTVSEFTEVALSCRYSSKRRWHPSSIILAYSCICSFSFKKIQLFLLHQHLGCRAAAWKVAILFWDNIPYLHFSNTVRAGWVWFMNK